VEKHIIRLLCKEVANYVVYALYYYRSPPTLSFCNHNFLFPEYFLFHDYFLSVCYKTLSLIVVPVCYVIRIGSSVHCVGIIRWDTKGA